MKQLPLTRGYVALVDDADYETLNKYKWTAAANSRQKRFYALRKVVKNGKSKTVWMHRFICDAPKGLMVDHVNGNSLDNRRCNLRQCNGSQNMINQGLIVTNKSGFKGVSWNKKKRKWTAAISWKNKQIHIGVFGEKENAARAYNEVAKRLFGEFARLNNIN